MLIKFRRFDLMVASGTLSAALLVGAGAAAVDFSPEPNRLVLYLASMLAVAIGAWWLLVRPTRSPLQPRSVWLVAVVVAIQAAAFTFGGTTVGTYRTFGLAAHQISWIASGTVILAVVLVDRRREPSVPPWLLAYGLVLLVVNAVFYPDAESPVFDVGLSLVAIGGMWQLATILARPGGVMSFLGMIACAYWVILGIGVAVEYGGVALGSITASLVDLPWQLGITQIFTEGNYQGYGAVGGQGGREIGAVVAVYHFLAWRRGQAPAQLVLAALAALVFLTAYGRIPLLGGLVAFAIVLAHRPGRGLDTRRVAAFGVLGVGLMAVPAVNTAVIQSVTAKRAGARSIDTGHLSLWAQHLDLFVHRPLVGVGANATVADLAQATRTRVYNPMTTDLTQQELRDRGSRGEGGWTGMVAQRGILGGGIILALVGAGLAYCLRAYPEDDAEGTDLVALRALFPAALLWFITDIPPLGIYTLSAFLASMLTLIAVAKSAVSTR